MLLVCIYCKHFVWKLNYLVSKRPWSRYNNFVTFFIPVFWASYLLLELMIECLFFLVIRWSKKMRPAIRSASTGRDSNNLRWSNVIISDTNLLANFLFYILINISLVINRRAKNDFGHFSETASGVLKTDQCHIALCFFYGYF